MQNGDGDAVAKIAALQKLFFVSGKKSVCRVEWIACKLRNHEHKETPKGSLYRIISY